MFENYDIDTSNLTRWTENLIRRPEFIEACQNGDTEMATLLLADSRIDVNKPDPSRDALLLSRYMCQSCMRDVLELINSNEHSRQCIANDILVSLKPHLSVDQASRSQSERGPSASNILGIDSTIVDILPEPEAEQCGLCGHYFNRSTLVEHHPNCPDLVSFSYHTDKLDITGLYRSIVADVEYAPHLLKLSSDFLFLPGIFPLQH